MRYLQFVQTITFAMLVMATIVSKINRRQYWEIPRPRLGWFEVISGDIFRCWKVNVCENNEGILSGP